MSTLSAMATRHWVRIPRSSQHLRARLVCLPHAGAGASVYYRWASRLEAAGFGLCSIQYPGREERVGEQPLSSWREMVGEIADLWPDMARGERCAVFGHSMGALLGFELTHELIRRGVANPPTRLFLSGRNPPHAVPRRRSISELADHDFLEQLIVERDAALPAEVLTHPEMRAIVTRTLRADYTLTEAHSLSDRPPLPTRFSVFGGTRDGGTSAEALAQWNRYTTAPCRLRMFDGDHFFHQASFESVVQQVVSDLVADALDPTGRAIAAATASEWGAPVRG